MDRLEAIADHLICMGNQIAACLVYMGSQIVAV